MKKQWELGKPSMHHDQSRKSLERKTRDRPKRSVWRWAGIRQVKGTREKQ